MWTRFFGRLDWTPPAWPRSLYRGYVIEEHRKLKATDQGIWVTDFF